MPVLDLIDLRHIHDPHARGPQDRKDISSGRGAPDQGNIRIDYLDRTQKMYGTAWRFHAHTIHTLLHKTLLYIQKSPFCGPLSHPQHHKILSYP